MLLRASSLWTPGERFWHCALALRTHSRTHSGLARIGLGGIFLGSTLTLGLQLSIWSVRFSQFGGVYERNNYGISPISRVFFLSVHGTGVPLSHPGVPHHRFI